MSGVIQGWHVPHDRPARVQEYGKVRVIEFQDKNGDMQFAHVKYDTKDWGNGVVDIEVNKIIPTTTEYDEKELLFDVEYNLREEYGYEGDITISVKAL